jgi:hypothetical protein
MLTLITFLSYEETKYNFDKIFLLYQELIVMADAMLSSLWHLNLITENALFDCSNSLPQFMQYINNS